MGPQVGAVLGLYLPLPWRQVEGVVCLSGSWRDAARCTAPAGAAMEPVIPGGPCRPGGWPPGQGFFSPLRSPGLQLRGPPELAGSRFRGGACGTRQML